MNYDGVIFDFNGVLLWDNPLHEQAWRVYSERLRGHPLTVEEMQTVVHGRTNRDVFDYVLGRRISDEELQPLIEEKERIYQRLALAEGAAYQLSPGAVELLDFLRDNAVPRAIATSSPGMNIEFYSEQLHLLNWFTPQTIIYDRGLYPGKPAPDMYLEAAERLGRPPSRLIVVEDAIMGVASAHAAGIGLIISIGPAEEHAQLAELPGVAHTIETLGQFPRELLVMRET